MLSLMWLACVRSIAFAEDVKSAGQIADAARAVLSARCISCHGPDAQEGGLRLDSREAVLLGGDSGPSLIPGDGDASLIMKAVRQTHESLSMPPKEKLHSEQIAALERWIKDGAQWPSEVLVLFDDEEAFIPTLSEGDAQIRLEEQDKYGSSD